MKASLNRKPMVLFLRSIKPIPPMPPIIRSQVEGSGTAEMGDTLGAEAEA